jgi:hypothetical protein
MSESTGVAVEKQSQLRPPKPTDFKLVAQIGQDVYVLVPLQGDPRLVKLVVRFKKTTGHLDSYDVHLDVNGEWGCTCLGFCHHGMCKDGLGCKHVKTVRALLRVFNQGGTV